MCDLVVLNASKRITKEQSGTSIPSSSALVDTRMGDFPSRNASRLEFLLYYICRMDERGGGMKGAGEMKSDVLLRRYSSIPSIPLFRLSQLSLISQISNKWQYSSSVMVSRTIRNYRRCSISVAMSPFNSYPLGTTVLLMSSTTPTLHHSTLLYYFILNPAILHYTVLYHTMIHCTKVYHATL